MRLAKSEFGESGTIEACLAPKNEKCVTFFEHEMIAETKAFEGFEDVIRILDRRKTILLCEAE